MLSSYNSISADGGCRVNSNESSEQPRLSLSSRVARSLVGRFELQSRAAGFWAGHEPRSLCSSSSSSRLEGPSRDPFPRSSLPLFRRPWLSFSPRSPFPRPATPSYSSPRLSVRSSGTDKLKRRGVFLRIGTERKEWGWASNVSPGIRRVQRISVLFN